MSTSKPGKIIVIGLDGATFDLIKPWAEAGYLPTLNRILQSGAHGVMRSTVPPMTAPAWTTFATGSNPGQHRLYDWIAREPDSYKFTPVTALDGKAPTIYTLLSEYGRSVVALNIPMTYPPVPVNGVMVSGMPTPSTKVTFTYPESAYQDILDNVGDYILYPDPGQAYSDSGIDSFLERLYRCRRFACGRPSTICANARTRISPCWFSTAPTPSATPCGNSWTKNIRCMIPQSMRSMVMPFATITATWMA